MSHPQPSVYTWESAPYLRIAPNDSTKLCRKCEHLEAQFNQAVVSMTSRSWLTIRTQELLANSRWDSQPQAALQKTTRVLPSSTQATAIGWPSRPEWDPWPRTWHLWNARSSRSSKIQLGVKPVSSQSERMEQQEQRRKFIRHRRIRDSLEVQLAVESQKQVALELNRLIARASFQTTTRSLTMHSFRASKRWYLPLMASNIPMVFKWCNPRLNTMTVRVKSSNTCNEWLLYLDQTRRLTEHKK